LPTIFKPSLGSHCKANIVVRSDSIAIQFLVGFLRRHVGFTQFVFHHLSNLCQPHNQIRPLIVSDGGAVGYRPPVHNDYFTTDSESSLLCSPHIIVFYTGNCKFLDYNAEQEESK